MFPFLLRGAHKKTRWQLTRFGLHKTVLGQRLSKLPTEVKQCFAQLAGAVAAPMFEIGSQDLAPDLQRQVHRSRFLVWIAEHISEILSHLSREILLPVAEQAPSRQLRLPTLYIYSAPISR